MSEPHQVLNAMSAPVAALALTRCCGAERWVRGMLERLPFPSTPKLMAAADSVYHQLDRSDYLEAFSHHPQIGTAPADLARRFASTAAWSANEQSGVADADSATLTRLRDRNLQYAARFGYIFIVCAAGKSAKEMLALIEQRLPNDDTRELQLAAAEQAKIMRLRLAKLAEITNDAVADSGPTG